MLSGQLTTPDRFSYHTGRATADNMWASPPTFVDRRAAADNLSARRRCHCCCIVILLQFLMTKRSSDFFRIERNFFENLWKKIHLAAQMAAPPPICLDGGAPPPLTKIYRRPADTMTMAHGSKV